MTLVHSPRAGRIALDFELGAGRALDVLDGHAGSTCA
jgi:hypothetical protein